MIVRKQTNGELILIGQTDHSRLVGQLAAHWGNDTFTTPDPYDSMVRAATFHDYGWLRYETSPLVHPDTGEPYSFLQLPLGEAQLNSYQWSLDWMAGIDRYAGLIVSMHRTGLWRNRYDLMTYPNGYNIREVSSDVREFVEKNERWQDEERKLHDPEKLRTNYQLMQTWDLLGLYFCCRELYEDYIDPVPTDYSNHSARLKMRPSQPQQVIFEPYPFDTRPLRIQLAFKRLFRTAFESVEEFQRAYFRAEVDLFHFELI
jgi:hypothetical protein